METDIHIEYIYQPVHPWKKRCLGRLYYYKGNFFYPLNLETKIMGNVCRSIRQFIKANKEMVSKDRKSPDYVPYDKLEKL